MDAPLPVAPLLVLGLVVVGFALAAPLTAALVRLGHRAGALDSAGAAGHAKELRRVPNIGGVAIVAAVAVPLALAMVAALVLGQDRLAQAAPAIASSVRRLPEALPAAGAILVGMLCLHAVGLVDDRRALPALPKLAAQLAVALGTVLAGDIRVLHFIDASVGGPWLGIALSALWIVALVNSLNFLDNMDGLSGGTGLIGAAALCVAATIAKQWMTAGMLALLVGALLGFLLFNFPWTRGRTARIFMGDGGSLVVGYLLATLSMQIVYTAPEQEGYALGTHWYGIFTPLVVLAVPLYDTGTVVGLRLLQRRSPMVGDQQHFSHRLVMRGLSRRGAVLLICALAGVCGVGGLLLGTSAPWQAALIALQTGLVLLTIAALERPMLAQMQADARK